VCRANGDIVTRASLSLFLSLSLVSSTVKKKKEKNKLNPFSNYPENQKKEKKKKREKKERKEGMARGRKKFAIYYESVTFMTSRVYVRPCSLWTN